VANELRQLPAVVVSNGKELHRSEDMVDELPTPLVDPGDAICWGDRSEVEEACGVPTVGYVEACRADLAPWRTVEDQRCLRLRHVVKVPE
jgi:hypothetical protein